MSTNFPTVGVDNYQRPSASDHMNDAGVEGDVVVDNIYDAIEALETKLGIDSSADTTSIDYKLKNTSNGHDHDGTDSKKVLGTNLNVTGLTAAQLIRVNAGGDAIESSGKTVPTGDILGTTDTQSVTNKTIDDTNNVKLRAQQGFLINGQLSRSVATNDITFSIKTLAGTDPSSTDPVYVRIGNTIRTITAAVTKTLNDGTNWFNAGAAELATFEIDYFAYLGWRAASSEVFIGIARIPYGVTYADFSATTTNEKYFAYSSSLAPSSTDEVENIGRFNATLSATASFNWSVPATSVIVSRPIFTTRLLQWQPTYSASGSMTWGTITTTNAKYTINHNKLYAHLQATGTTGGTPSTTLQASSPFATSSGTQDTTTGTRIRDSSFVVGGLAINSSTLQAFRYDLANFGSGANRGILGNISYLIG